MEQRREELRVADVDRTFVADLLKSAVDEGRLSLGEYDERLRDAYAARTYGDLDRLIMDLPGVVGLTTHAPRDSQLAKPERSPGGAPIPDQRWPSSTPDAGAVGPAAALGGTLKEPGFRGGDGGPRLLSRWLAVVWGAWLFAVSINLVIWFLVSVSSDDGPAYFWPMWVAGPWGTLLLGTTFLRLVAGRAMNRSGFEVGGTLEDQTAYRVERLRYRAERRAAKRRARAARRGRFSDSA